MSELDKYGMRIIKRHADYDKRSEILPQKCVYCYYDVNNADTYRFRVTPTKRVYYHVTCYNLQKQRDSGL